MIPFYLVNIKRLREGNNYSQEYIAEQIGVKQNTYSRIENNQYKLSVDMLFKISKVLGHTPAFLLKKKEVPSETSISESLNNLIDRTNKDLENLKRIYERLLQEKDERIKMQNESLVELRSIIKSLKNLLKDI